MRPRAQSRGRPDTHPSKPAIHDPVATSHDTDRPPRIPPGEMRARGRFGQSRGLMLAAHGAGSRARAGRCADAVTASTGAGSQRASPRHGPQIQSGSRHPRTPKTTPRPRPTERHGPDRERFAHGRALNGIDLAGRPSGRTSARPTQSPTSSRAPAGRSDAWREADRRACRKTSDGRLGESSAGMLCAVRNRLRRLRDVRGEHLPAACARRTARRPASISYATHAERVDVGAVIDVGIARAACSGAMYAGVPSDDRRTDVSAAADARASRDADERLGDAEVGDHRRCRRRAGRCPA